MSKFPNNSILIECQSCKLPKGKIGGYTLKGVLHRGDFASVWINCNNCGEDSCINISLSSVLVIGRLNGDNPDKYKEVEVKIGDLNLTSIVSMIGKIKHALT